MNFDSLLKTCEYCCCRTLSGKNYFDILEVDQTATDEDIKQAYKRKAKLLHPDKNRAPSAKDAMQGIHCDLDQSIFLCLLLAFYSFRTDLDLQRNEIEFITLLLRSSKKETINRKSDIFSDNRV